MGFVLAGHLELECDKRVPTGGAFAVGSALGFRAVRDQARDAHQGVLFMLVLPAGSSLSIQSSGSSSDSDGEGAETGAGFAFERCSSEGRTAPVSNASPLTTWTAEWLADSDQSEEACGFE